LRPVTIAHANPRRAIGFGPFGDYRGIADVAVNKIATEVSDPGAWIKKSAELAKQFAYAPPVSTGTNAVLLPREYEMNARNIARSRAALAPARMANLLNSALK
jgi:S1/P1 Nuclease